MSEPAISMLSTGSSKQRFTETVKFLPVVFIWANIIGLYLIYMNFHCMPLYRHPHYHTVGALEVAVFNVITALLVICYLLCILVHPGTIPEKEEDPSWEYVPQDQMIASGCPTMNLQEAKRSGDRRHCKWCAKYKPDRCHHCRVCRMCILKMDHHCPWIYNCVGFRNHKYFFLFIFYVAIDCHIITWTMLDSVKNSVDNNTPFMTMFLLLFGETLAAFVGILVSAFWGFHVWLMLKSMTTIEFCEKSMRNAGYESSVYDRGCTGNIRAVLGDHVLLWPLPCSPPSGEGLVFTSEDTPIARDLEASAPGERGQRRRNKPVSYGGLKRQEPEQGQGQGR